MKLCHIVIIPSYSTGTPFCYYGHGAYQITWSGLDFVQLRIELRLPISAFEGPAVTDSIYRNMMELLWVRGKTLVCHTWSHQPDITECNDGNWSDHQRPNPSLCSETGDRCTSLNHGSTTQHHVFSTTVVFCTWMCIQIYLPIKWFVYLQFCCFRSLVKIQSACFAILQGVIIFLLMYQWYSFTLPSRGSRGQAPSAMYGDGECEGN